MSSWPFLRAVAASIFCLFFVLIACCARGEDTYYSGEPKLRVEGARSVRLLKTSIRIENFNVNIKHSFKNEGRQRARLTFNLDVPSFDNRGEGTLHPDRSYSDLIMSLDGKRVSYSANSRASLNGTDVTRELARISLRPNDVSRFDIAAGNGSALPEASATALRTDGLINAQRRPLWTAKNDYAFQTELATRAAAVYQYVYTGLPGIFYVEPDDVDRPEIVRLLGAPWNTLRNAFGGAKRIQGFTILRVMQLPLWTDSWQQPADQLEIHISMSPVGDKQCLIVLLLDGQTYTGEGRLRLVLNKYRAKKPGWLVVYSPFGVH